MALTAPAFRRALLAWYDAGRRDLPWRQSNDFYRVWISEVMLQQTRVEAAIPYYHRFLARFPGVRDLAEAPEADVLAAWSGLGYYSRARNLQRAARQITEQGVPSTHDEILGLRGAGTYTAAAIASIALGLPHAAVDGNVLRVLTRLADDEGEITSARTRTRLGETAQALLDPGRPGDFNQAMMELGATVCVPRTPRCGECPVRAFCAARAAGRERELPVKRKKPAARERRLDLLAVLWEGRVLLVRRGEAEKRLAGFWELPVRSVFPGVRAKRAGGFTHRIVNDRFRVAVWMAAGDAAPAPVDGGRWFGPAELSDVPVTTVTRKALAEIRSAGGRKRVEQRDGDFS